MLRGMGRVFCGGRDRRVRQRQQPTVFATDLFGGGLERWREHGREDSQSCASCTLPVQVGVALRAILFCQLQEAVRCAVGPWEA